MKRAIFCFVVLLIPCIVYASLFRDTSMPSKAIAGHWKYISNDPVENDNSWSERWFTGNGFINIERGGRDDGKVVNWSYSVAEENVSNRSITIIETPVMGGVQVVERITFNSNYTSAQIDGALLGRVMPNWFRLEYIDGATAP